MAAGETTPLLAPDPESLSLKDDEGVSARASVEDFASFLSLDLFSDLLEHQRPQPDVLSSNQKALVSHLGSGSSIDVNTSDLPEHDLAASGGALLYLLLKTKPSKRQQSKMTSSQQIAHSARCQNRQGVLSEAFQRWVDLVAAKESGCMTQNGTPCEDLLASLLHHPFSLEGQTSCC